MSLNAYTPQENGNLKHLAEAEGTSEQLAEFIEAVQDAYPRQKDGPFVVIDIDNGFSAYVEFEDEEVVEVRRVLKIGGVTVSNGTTEAAEEAAPRRRAKPGPKPGSKRKPAAKTTAAPVKRTVRKAAAPKAAATKVKRTGSGFKRNAASAE